MKEIDKEMTIMELLEEDASLGPMLREMGFGCTGCPMSQLETLEMGALGHGMDPDKVIEEINKRLEEKNSNGKNSSLVKTLSENGLEVEDE